MSWKNKIKDSYIQLYAIETEKKNETVSWKKKRQIATFYKKKYE